MSSRVTSSSSCCRDSSSLADRGAARSDLGPLRVDVITIFPELFDRFLETSFVGIARDRGALEVAIHDLRRWTSDRHRTVDDAPYGGGPGMVMKPEPLVAAIESLAGPKGRDRQARVVLMTPQGGRLDQPALESLAEQRHLVLICGRYEGVDQRVIELAVDEEISIGDFVLSGGEVPAMAIVEGMARLLPGVLGNPESAANESFREDLLEGPQYTRPPRFRDLAVPEVLRSGDHAAILRWRRERAAEITGTRRPDLLGSQTAGRAAVETKKRTPDAASASQRSNTSGSNTNRKDSR